MSGEIRIPVQPARSDDPARAKYDGVDYPSLSMGDVDGTVGVPVLPVGTGLPIRVMVAPLPVADWSNPFGDYAAAGVEIAFGNNSQWAHTYEWDFGGGDTSTEETPTRIFTAGIRGITLTAISDYGAEAEHFAYLHVVDIVASFSYAPADPDPGEEITFTDTSPYAETWAWDFGDGNTATERHPAHTFPTAGTYTVTLTITGYGGTATISQTVEVASAATWQEITDNTYWTPEDAYPWPWGDHGYCFAGDAWCLYAYVGENPAVLLPAGGWAAGWRPSEIVIYGCDFDYDPFRFRLLDTAGNVIASGGLGGAGNTITFQGQDIARLEYWQQDTGSIYGCVTGIHFFGPPLA